MTEVQSHGFAWEKNILEDVYCLTTKDISEIGYTNKSDIPARYNKLDNVDVSIKTSGNANCVYMADCLRFYDSVSSDTPLHLILVQYEQCDETKHKLLKSVIQFDLTNAKEILFGDISRDDIKSLDSLVKSVPQKRSPTKEEHTQMYALKKLLQAQCFNIRLDIKCNSQQSRLQCSIHKLKNFMDEYPERILNRSEGTIFRGISLLPKLQSDRRKFIKKISDL